MAADREPLRGLSHRAQVALVGGAALLFAVQLAHTFLGQSHWPFCSYDMFSARAGAAVTIPRAILYDERGGSRVVDAGRVVPIEFFRARALFGQVFAGGDAAPKRHLARTALRWLNDRPWPGFDEIEPAASPASGARYTGMDVVMDTVATDPAHLSTPPSFAAPLRRRLLFQYRP